MKTLKQFILEELDVDIFWLLDKWFERNETQKSEFIEIVIKCIKDKIIQTPKIKEYLKNTILEKDLEEFVNFIDNEVEPENEKDYFERFKVIIKQVINWKDDKNIYIKNEPV